jgi:hypothetical protein
MPQLEVLGIAFNSHFPSGDIERQSLRTPITMHVTLPSLRWFAFLGASAYLEALLPRVTIPLLERLQVQFFNQLTYSIPNRPAVYKLCRKPPAQQLHAHSFHGISCRDGVSSQGGKDTYFGNGAWRPTPRLAGSMPSTSFSHAQGKNFCAEASYASIIAGTLYPRSGTMKRTAHSGANF